MRQIKRILPIVTAFSLLAACNTAVPSQTVAPTTENTTTFTEKVTKYAEDDTTEVLVDAEIKPEDITKVVKHGDHWHVFTKDGRERITYTDPTAKQKTEKTKGGLEFVSVISLSQLAKLPITEIKQHGDHYHCYTADGTEYITYENPSKAFPNIKIGKYVGSHGQHQHKHGQCQTCQNKNKQGKHLLQGESINQKGSQAGKTSGKHNSKHQDPNEVVTILQHGDHWHVYTADGREFITYSDPTSQYPNATVGTYHGSHGSTGHESKPYTPSKPDKPHKPAKPDGPHEHDDEHTGSTVNPSKPSGGSKHDDFSGFVQTLKPEQLADKHIVKILQHEDHWHCYDANNKEYVVMGHTQAELQKYCPNATFGQYTGKHGDSSESEHKHNDKCPIKVTHLDRSNPKAIAKLLKHGDHWHTLLVDGSSGPISFCPDLEKYYPDAEVGEYSGSISEEDEHAKIDENNNPNVLDDEDGVSKVQAFLAKFYGVDSTNVTFEYGSFTVKNGSEDITVNPSVLELKDGNIVIKSGKSLPALTIKKEKPAVPEQVDPEEPEKKAVEEKQEDAKNEPAEQPETASKEVESSDKQAENEKQDKPGTTDDNAEK